MVSPPGATSTTSPVNRHRPPTTSMAVKLTIRGAADFPFSKKTNSDSSSPRVAGDRVTSGDAWLSAEASQTSFGTTWLEVSAGGCKTGEKTSNRDDGDDREAS